MTRPKVTVIKSEWASSKDSNFPPKKESLWPSLTDEVRRIDWHTSTEDMLGLSPGFLEKWND